MINRGDVYEAELAAIGRRPVVVVTRQVAIQYLSNVTVAEITSTVRGHLAEVEVGKENGLANDCVINCDNLHTIAKGRLAKFRGSLNPEQAYKLNSSLKIALGLR